MMEEIYKENILDHYKNPRNKKDLSKPDLKGLARNTSCGDTAEIFIKLENGVVSEAAFQGDGCAISQASASMLTEKIKGMKLENLKLLSPGDIYNMLGVKISPGRTGCALLSYQALENALKNAKS